MSPKDADLLRRICSGEISSIVGLDDMDVQRISAFEKNKLLQTWISGDIDVFPAAHDALDEYDRLDQERSSSISNDEAERKTGRRHDWRIAVIGAIIVGIILVVAENLAELVPWEKLVEHLIP